MISIWMLMGLIVLGQDSDASREAQRLARGHGLLADCQTFESEPPKGGDAFDAWMVAATRCTSYVSGLFDGLAEGKKICVPTGVTTDQSVLIVLKALRGQPERLNEWRRAVASEALIVAFPCKR